MTRMTKSARQLQDFLTEMEGIGFPKLRALDILDGIIQMQVSLSIPECIEEAKRRIASEVRETTEKMMTPEGRRQVAHDQKISKIIAGFPHSQRKV